MQMKWRMMQVFRWICYKWLVSNKFFFSVTVNSVFYSLNFVSKVLSLTIPFSLDITICYLWFKDVLVLIENVVSSFSTCNLWAIKRYSKSKGICYILNQLLCYYHGNQLGKADRWNSHGQFCDGSPDTGVPTRHLGTPGANSIVPR